MSLFVSYFSACYFYFFLVSFIFTMGWVSVYFFRSQLLFSLISLEFLVLSFFLGCLGVFGFVGSFLSVSLYLLVLGACEATLGLCLLVSLVRLLGSDMLANFNLVKC